MQHHRSNLSPLPDIGRAPSVQPCVPARPALPPPAPDFIIIALFALRLTKRLIEGLENYPGRDAHIIWLVNFLAPYSNGHSLAKISGRQKDDYVQMYPRIVSRMKKQPRYPIRFMQMNPDRSLHQPRVFGEVEQPREMTDAERLRIIDFCDAAGEWGSAVPIPAREAGRMIELAGQRRVADLDLEQKSRQSRFEHNSRDAYNTGSSDRDNEVPLREHESTDVRARRRRRVSFADAGQEFEERMY